MRDVGANQPSDPFLFSGFERRGVHLSHASDRPVEFKFEIDRKGNNQWEELERITVAEQSAVWHSFAESEQGTWLRISLDQEAKVVNAQFQYSNSDPRPTTADAMFSGLAQTSTESLSGGLVYVRGRNLRTLGFCATQVVDGKPVFARILRAR